MSSAHIHNSCSPPAAAAASTTWLAAFCGRAWKLEKVVVDVVVSDTPVGIRRARCRAQKGHLVLTHSCCVAPLVGLTGGLDRLAWWCVPKAVFTCCILYSPHPPPIQRKRAAVTNLASPRETGPVGCNQQLTSLDSLGQNWKQGTRQKAAKNRNS